jgi:hypothetical protein
MHAVFKRLMASLTAFAFILAMSVQAAPSVEALGLTAPAKAAKADQDCPRMAAEHSDQGAPDQMPCKGIVLDCVKQMGCIGSPNLPSRYAELRTPVSYSTVVYWLPAEESAGLSIAPDLLPPRAG